jgi:CelD/BcsL family acetyltransferase involved in cellulose biosynthesis
LALYFLTAGGQRVASHFALVEDGAYYLLKPGYDPTLAQHGLGHLLVFHVARALIAEGVRELDFLGDDLPWKRDWTATRRTHAFRYILRPTLKGRLLHRWKFDVVPALRRDRSVRC